MDKFRVTSSKLTANPGKSGWAQVHEFKPEDEKKLALRGHLFAVVATSKTEGSPVGGLDSLAAGRELLTRFHEEYFGKVEGSAFNALREAIEKVINEFKDTWGQVEISAAVLLGDVVYSATGGGGMAAVFREGSLAKILESKQTEVVAASGYPKEGDIFLLATASVFGLLGQGVIKAALATGNPEEAVEFLAPTVHAKEEPNLGLVVIKFEKPGVFRPALAKRKIAGVNLALQKVKSGLAALAAKLPGKKIYVRREETDEGVAKGRKTAISIGAILLLLLIVSIGFGIRQKRVRQARLLYEDRLISAQQNFEEAVKLFSLNPERARELFVESRQIVDTLLAEGVEDNALEGLARNLEQNRGHILAEFKEEPELFIDLSLLSSGFSGDGLAAGEGNLFILDKKGKKVVQITIETKRAEVVVGPELIDEAGDIAAYAERIFILTSEGVFEVGKEKKKIIEADWEGEVLTHAYAGNLYVLEKNISAVWRYPVLEEGFGAKQKWLAPGVEPDLTRIFSWTIDGSIWFVSETGGIFKFTRGNQESVTFTGVSPEITSPSAIYTSEELDYFYVLERKTNRVIVFDKKGSYIAQYSHEAIGQAKNLAVSEAQGKIILLTGDKLTFLQIKHLEE